MKTKLDFVTNSSSVSFIIGEVIKKDKPELGVVTIPVNVYLNNLISESISTVEELNKSEYIDQNYDYESYETALDIINNGGVVHILHVYNDGDDIGELAAYYQGIEGGEVGKNLRIIKGAGEP